MSLAVAASPEEDRARRHILVVDDDKRIRTLLTRYLAAEGYIVSAAADAEQATALLGDMEFDLIVLDVMMPGESGVQFAQRLRRDPGQSRTAPILMLTALGETRDRLDGLEAGVDDYLAKPFEPRELSLRIAAILRRASRPARLCGVTAVRFGAFVFDLEKGRLLEHDKFVHLTTRESEILTALSLEAGAIVPRQRLARRAVDGKVESAGERSVDVEIARLRRKIERDEDGPRHLQTIRGRGYRLWVDEMIGEDEENGSKP
ncbi:MULTISPECIES: response regulator [Methylosinus]|uniref:DNA-binding response regulator n=1 Tax=Methylosinus trichosporium (strain ATCC 35070 / NCIMB 11131 / UNIQEM 75 / OB3b) TaxID=595536 RepID=A0A2D2CW83_METT3|nr:MULTISPECIES: response regulator transcription factor [Methylosinus]ATQ66934.1 DNA-binding response regulator [Methylosinus trichosporium OB3b]OBS54100.1 DNA-binding response regulator [Methylosinus sp. 3S-1]